MPASWEWLKNYRVWDANRSVFLYPENWIEPEPRRSSSEQFRLGEIVKVAQTQRTSVLLASAVPATTLLAARALAADLGRNLFRVGLTQVVAKYIGETEKNLDRVFAAAAQAQAVLLFDEADALFGTRSNVTDSHDRFANAEVGYLLQRIEAFEGLVLVASNVKNTAVAALSKRFAHIVELPA